MGRSKMIIGISCLLASQTLNSGCQIQDKNTDKNKNTEIRVGVLLYNMDDLFISVMTQKLDEGFREQEKKEDFKITVNFSDAKGSQTLQNSQIDKFIDQDYDVLCVDIVDRTDAAEIVDKGERADVPIVFFNREPVSADMKRWDKTYYVGTDSEEGGRQQGELFLEEYKKDKESIDRNGDGIIQYVILEGEPGHQDSMIRTESCLKTLKSAGIQLERLGTACANWTRTQGKEKMEGWLQGFGDTIEILFSNNDAMALGALDAMEENDIPFGQIKVIGLDGMEEAVTAIQEGKMLGTVLNDADAQVKSIIEIAISLGKKETPTDIDYMDSHHAVRVPHRIIK